jgi:hypothetical protein
MAAFFTIVTFVPVCGRSPGDRGFTAQRAATRRGQFIAFPVPAVQCEASARLIGRVRGEHGQ